MKMNSFKNILLRRENFDVLFWVENVLKTKDNNFKLKIFLFSLSQVELPVFKYIVCTSKLLVQSLLYTYQKVVK